MVRRHTDLQTAVHQLEVLGEHASWPCCVNSTLLRRPRLALLLLRVAGLLPLLPPPLQLRLHLLARGEKVALHEVHLLALVLVLQGWERGGARVGPGWGGRESHVTRAISSLRRLHSRLERRLFRVRGRAVDVWGAPCRCRGGSDTEQGGEHPAGADAAHPAGVEEGAGAPCRCRRGRSCR